MLGGMFVATRRRPSRALVLVRAVKVPGHLVLSAEGAQRLPRRRPWRSFVDDLSATGGSASA
jgi:hypothetical protein